MNDDVVINGFIDVHFKACNDGHPAPDIWWPCQVIAMEGHTITARINRTGQVMVLDDRRCGDAWRLHRE